MGSFEPLKERCSARDKNTVYKGRASFDDTSAFPFPWSAVPRTDAAWLSLSGSPVSSTALLASTRSTIAAVVSVDARYLDLQVVIPISGFSGLPPRLLDARWLAGLVAFARPTSSRPRLRSRRRGSAAAGISLPDVSGMKEASGDSQINYPNARLTIEHQESTPVARNSRAEFWRTA